MGRPTDWHVLDLDGDPTPGDPTRVEALARRLHSFAEDVGSALRQVRGLSGDSAVQEWTGQAAEEYRSYFDGVPDKLAKLERSYRMCGDALAAYWPKLQQAQGDADRALERGRQARADLARAQAQLGNAEDWVSRAGREAEKYQEEPKGDAPKPSESQVRAATRNYREAQQAQQAAQSAVDDAQARLEAAKQLAADAKQLRDEAADRAKRDIDEASDAGMQNKKWYEKVVDWVVDHWDDIVAVCKVVVAVLGVVVMIVGGPLAWVVLGAALVVLADTLIKFAQGKAGLWDVAFAALDCIPGFKGLTTLGGLAALAKGGLKTLGRMKGQLDDIAGALRGGVERLRSGLDDLVGRAKQFTNRCAGGDPIDLVTGEMLMADTDVALPGLLPLRFRRTHISSYRWGRWLGPSWTSTLDERLELDDEGVVFASEDGMLLSYPVPSPGTPVLPHEGPRWPLAWDGTPNGDITITDPATGVTRHFRAVVTGPQGVSGLLPLCSLTDRNGHRIDIEYTPTGVPRAMRHSGGYHIAVEVTGDRITALRLVGTGDEQDSTPLVSYSYDSRGNLSGITNSSGRPFQLVYDDVGRIVKWVDRKGSWYAFEYDDQDRCVRGTGADGFLNCTLTYDTEARATVYTDSLGQSTVHRYNERLQRTSVTDPLGNTTTSEWDDRDRLVAQVDPRGATTRYEYDEAGNLVGITYPDGTTATAEFNEFQLPSSVTDGSGARWTYRYDERGNRTAITDPLGATTTFDYDDRGGLVRITDPLGNVTRIETDERGLPAKVTDPAGNTVTHTRDAFGRIVAITDAAGEVTRLTWTVEGKPASRTTPDGATETWTWDAEGNLLRHTDPSGASTRFTYTHFDLVATQTGPDGAQRTFGYDTECRLTSVTDASGLTWTYAHDAAGRLISETDFNGRTLTYAYDAAGHLVSRTNGAGQTVEYERDAVGRIIRKHAGDHVTTFTYGPTGQLRRAAGPDAVVEVERDALGRLTAETVNGQLTAYAYDPLGRRVKRTTAAGVTSEWSYRGNGLPSRLDSAGHTVTFAHDAIGRETELAVDNTLRISREWSVRDRLLSQRLALREGEDATRVLGHTSYTYGDSGQLVGIEDLHEGAQRFRLDARGRVAAVEARNWTERYAYDEMGNLAAAEYGGSATDGETGRRYRGNLLHRSGRDTYEYDQQGRLARRIRRTLSGKRRTWHYVWDADDHLVELYTPEGHRWRYRYDPLGRRVGKERVLDDGTVLRRVDFSWDGDRLIEQREHLAPDDPRQVRVTTWDYEPGGHRPLTQVVSTPAREASQEEIDRRFHAIVTDLTGAPSDLVSPHGEVVWYRRATLWGARRDGGQAATDDGGVTCPLRFPGQYEDEESGLHYNRHRYYDPEDARYLSADPLGLAAAPNHYAYVPNPYEWSDPLGLRRCPTFVRFQDLSPKELERVSFQYQRFVTGQGYEQVWRLGDGRIVKVDGGPTANGYIVEAKWTGNEKQWASSQYNPAHVHYNEDRIIAQAEKLLELNDGLGGRGVRYAVSNPQGAQHLADLFSNSENLKAAFADGRLQVFHVPATGMHGI